MRPKKPASRSIATLRRPGRNSLSCTTPCLTPRCLAQRRQRDRLVERIGDRFFAIDVLAGVDRTGDEIGPHLRRRGVEEHGVRRVGKRRVEIGARALDAVLPAQRRNFLGVAADQDRIRHHAVAVRQRDSALGADGDDRAHKMLVEAHAAGHAVHDDAEPLRGH